MADKLTVYLDHLIPRMSLRYKRSVEEIPRGRGLSQTENLPMSDLERDQYRRRILRKPDFQRATNAWSPEDCVSLLDSVVKSQVIPSIIMWFSEDGGLEYVLDGAHRISVVMAWLHDDWGDDIPSEIEDLMDGERVSSIKKAATQVRAMVDSKIGNVRDYKDALEEFDQINRKRGAPATEMLPEKYKLALFYNGFLRRAAKFDVLWVEGNYEIAEQSFVKINKSGRQISDWERKLIENRNSSFARVVMSLTSIDSVKHYWPAVGDNAIPEKADDIIDGIIEFNRKLFTPNFGKNFQLRLPIMTFLGQDDDKKPYWLAELLTVIERGRGTNAETEALLAKDQASSPEMIIDNGHRLVEDMVDCFDHFTGKSPRSLAIVPAIYFYSRSLRYIRSLLYGFIYWLLDGSSGDILQRKRLFSGHRQAFEQVILEYRDFFTSGMNRKSGSGSEVTAQTARYYQEVLELIISHDDVIDSDEFLEAHGNLLIERFGLRKTSTQKRTEKSRSFTRKQRTAKKMDTLINSAPKCEICGGIFDPSQPLGYLQHDHIVEHFRGGQTSASNQRMVHPFCNNQANREAIEAIRGKTKKPTLPKFYGDVEDGAQLRLFDYESWSSF